MAKKSPSSMSKKSSPVVTLKEYVLGITKVFPNAIFSVFSEQDHIKRHKVRAPELLHAKQSSPEMVTCAFSGDDYFVSVAWHHDRIHGYGDSFHTYEKSTIPDELTNLILDSTMAKLNALLKVIKHDPTIKCDTFAEATHRMNQVRAADTITDDDDD